MPGGKAAAEEGGLTAFHVHPGHAFEGFSIEKRRGTTMLVATCACGAVLGVADAVFSPCPDCAGRGGACIRCGGTGQAVDHAALRWRLPDERGDPRGDDS